MKKIFKSLALIILFIFIYLLPLKIITLQNKSKIIKNIDQLPKSDTAIVFGTVVRNNQISPLLEERLVAGKEILINQKSSKITLSNTENATQAMKDYYENKISLDSIELDIQAEKTPDTCRYEKQQYPNGRKVIFISQSFHLPRLIYQCKKLGVEGAAFPAENVSIIDRSQYSFFTKITTRVKRYFREAGLTWLAVLNIYK